MDQLAPKKEKKYTLAKRRKLQDKLIQLLLENPDTEATVLAEKSGIPKDDYDAIVSNPDFFDDMYYRGRTQLWGPILGQVFKEIGDSAVAGDINKQKLLFELCGKKQVESAVNMNIVSANTEELLNRMEVLKAELKNQVGDDYIDIEMEEINGQKENKESDGYKQIENTEE